ncbi:MAG: hypothetical protein AB1598_13725 [Thermodesulfobacteriota bacterium]
MTYIYINFLSEASGTRSAKNGMAQNIYLSCTRVKKIKNVK